MGRILILVYRALMAVLMWPAGIVLSRYRNFRGTIPARLGLKLPEIPASLPLIWVHASSVGEVRAVTGLVKALRKEKPHTLICMSTMTATGSQVASSIHELDLVFPFPFDAAWVMRRYLSSLAPRALIVVETEIWPNLILEAGDMGIPVIIVNARMTERSFRRYALAPLPAREVLQHVHVLAISELDGGRFARLGARDVQVAGNLKLDSIAQADPSRRQQIRNSLGIAERPVFIAGSIREGEEEPVFSALNKAAETVPGLFAILAPRHPEQIPLLSDRAAQSPFTWCLRTAMKDDADLVIVDTMGELFGLYGASDVAFVGGSLVDLGGQNILEPLAWGVPTIHGPHMDNFTWAMEMVAGCTVQVADSDALSRAVTDVLTRPAGYLEKAREARSRLEKHRGVTERYLSIIKEHLP